MSSKVLNIKFKMVIFGAEGVGKTSLVQRFVSDKFDTNYDSTLGHNVYEKKFKLEGINISLFIFDFGGQLQFKSLRKKMSEGADTAFLVYDISSKESFDKLSEWRIEMLDISDDIPFILVGNKKDLAQERQVLNEEGKKLSEKIGAISFIETSAKTGEFVEDAFRSLTRLTLKKYEFLE